MSATQLLPDSEEHPSGRTRASDEPSAQLPLTLAAAAATLLTAVVLYAVLRQGDWFARSVGAVAIVAGVGAGARALQLPRPGVLLAQCGATVAYLTALYAAEPATAGIVPLRREAWAALGTAFEDGLVQLGALSPPVTPTRQIGLVVVLGVALTALLVDGLAVTYRRPALAGLPLLTAYLGLAGGLPDGLDFWYFVLPAAGYLVLLLMDGRARSPLMGPVIVPSVLVLAVGIPAVTPDLPEGALDRWTSSSGGGARTISTLNPLVDLRRDLFREADFPVLTLRTDSSRPKELYLRTATLDQFDGERWTFGRRQVESFDVDLPPPALGPAVATLPVHSTITIGDRLASDYLPVPYPTLSLDVPGSWRVDPQTGNVVSREGRRQVVGTTYTVDSLDLLPPSTDFVDGDPTPGDPRYTAVPDDLPAVVGRLAREQTAGTSTPLEAALALQSWFRDPDQFTYDLSARPGTGAPAIVDFLTDRRGYCEQFAATMAVMARTLGIPSRVNVGFTSGEPNMDGSRTISSRDAHAWPELELPGLGWTRFEPTPPGASSSPAVPAWMDVEDEAPRPAEPAQQAPAAPAPEPVTPPGTTETTRPACTGAEADPACVPSPAAVPPGGDAGAGADGPLGSEGLTLLAWVALLLAAAPAAGRAVIRRRRWARAADGRAAEAAWRELRDSAVDLGYTWPSARTPRQAADDLAAQAGLSAAGADALATIRTTVERARYAPAPRPGQSQGAPSRDALRRTVSDVRRELAAGVKRPARVRARVLPPSLLLRGGSR